MRLSEMLSLLRPSLEVVNEGRICNISFSEPAQNKVTVLDSYLNSAFMIKTIWLIKILRSQIMISRFFILIVIFRFLKLIHLQVLANPIHLPF